MSFNNHWRKYRLHELCNFETGKLNSNAAVKNGKYPFFTCAPKILSIDKFSYDQEAILLSGNNAEGIFNVKYYKGEFDAYQRTYIIEIKNNNILDYKYLYYLLIIYLNYLRELSIGTTTKFLTLKILNKIEIKIPPLEEQKQIAAILSSLDDKIELNNQINKNLEEIAQAIFKYWFIDFEFPNENGEPYKSSGGEMVDCELGPIPKGWIVIPFKEIIKISSGKRPKVRKTEKDKKYNIPLIGASSVMGYVSEILYIKPILVIGRVGTHGIVQRIKGKSWPSDNTLVIQSEHYEYTYQILINIDYQSLNRGSTQPLITQTDIKKYKIVFSKDNLLRDFEKRIGCLFQLINKNREENKVLSRIRDGLIPKFMSGEIRVPVNSKVLISENN